MPRPRKHRGYTLTELMVALSIFAFMSSAISSLMFASYNTHRVVRAETDTVSQVDSALRRMIENTRSASTLGPNFSTTCLHIVSQADPDNANTKYNIQYTLDAATGKLTETHDFYGTNVIATGVTTFTVTTVQATKPTMIRVNLEAKASGRAVARECLITSRNF